MFESSAHIDKHALPDYALFHLCAGKNGRIVGSRNAHVNGHILRYLCTICCGRYGKRERICCAVAHIEFVNVGVRIIQLVTVRTVSVYGKSAVFAFIGILNVAVGNVTTRLAQQGSILCVSDTDGKIPGSSIVPHVIVASFDGKIGLVVGAVDGHFERLG